jgi:Flp pilus assembly protein TadD
VAFSPDGQRILTGSWDGTAKVWEADSRMELLNLTEHSIEIASDAQTPKKHFARVYSAAYSRDGQRIVTASSDGTATLWEATSGRELLTLKGHSNWIFSAAFSPDGQRIVTGSEDQTAKVWDAISGRELLTLKGHSGEIASVAFSPDGQRIVSGSDDHTAKVWEAASGRELFTLKGHTEEIWSVAFSPDGQRIVTGSLDRTAKVWDAANGTNLLTLNGHRNRVYSVAFSPDGQRIVTGSEDHTAKVWEAASGRELLTLKGHSGEVVCVAFSPDGLRIVTGSRDHTARVWEAASPAQVAAWQEEERAAAQSLAAMQERQAIDDQLKQDSLSLARRVRWAEAAADLTQVIDHNPTDHELWYWLGAIYIQTGQIDAYRENCRKALEWFRQTTDGYTAESIAKDCLILPDSGANFDTLSSMADTAVAHYQPGPYFPFAQFCKGLAEYRQGRFVSATDWMRTVLTSSGTFLERDTQAYMVLAMSQCQLHQIDQARASLAKGAEIEHALPKVESGDIGYNWMDWIFAHALMREAKAMIGSQPATPEQTSPARRD